MTQEDQWEGLDLALLVDGSGQGKLCHTSLDLSYFALEMKLLCYSYSCIPILLIRPSRQVDDKGKVSADLKTLQIRHEQVKYFKQKEYYNNLYFISFIYLCRSSIYSFSPFIAARINI